jgi:hypothetical protein
MYTKEYDIGIKCNIQTKEFMRVEKLQTDSFSIIPRASFHADKAF